jgi:hypothetical protein
MISRVPFYSQHTGYRRPSALHDTVAILDGFRAWKEVPMLMERAIVRAMPDTEIKPGSKQLPERSTTERSASQGEMQGDLQADLQADLQGDLGIGRSRAFASRESAPLDFDQQRRALRGDPRYVTTVTVNHC